MKTVFSTASHCSWFLGDKWLGETKPMQMGDFVNSVSCATHSLDLYGNSSTTISTVSADSRWDEMPRNLCLETDEKNVLQHWRPWRRLLKRKLQQEVFTSIWSRPAQQWVARGQPRLGQARNWPTTFFFRLLLYLVPHRPYNVERSS
jgi:hypothetical protein